MNRGLPRTSALVGIALLCGACGGGAELSPEITAHLGEYEILIEQFEPMFGAARDNPPQFAKVADSYSRQAQAWIKEWDRVAPELSEEEGKAVKAAIDKLNRRAQKMLSGA